MKRITVRLPDAVIEAIENDVERGRFANVADGIRYITLAYYDEPEYSGRIKPLGELRGGSEPKLGGDATSVESQIDDLQHVVNGDEVGPGGGA